MSRFTTRFCSALLMAGTSLGIGFSSLATDKPDIKILSNQDVMSEHYLPDYSYAGYNNGVGEIPLLEGRVIDVTKYGVIADDDIDDSKALQKALEAAHKARGPVIVKFPQGKILISEILRINRSNIVLRGSGSGKNGTNLHFPRPLQMVDDKGYFEEIREYLVKYDKRQREKSKNIDVLFSEYSWTGGFIWIQKEETRAASYLEELDPPIDVLAGAVKGEIGTQFVTVENSRNLKAGDVVELQWLNRKGENGPFLKELYGDTELKIGSHHWTFEERPLVRQKTKILAIDGTSVKISDPLLHNITDDVPAQFATWEHLENVGIEDLSLTFPDSPAFGHHMERGYNGIYLTSVFDGWVRDVNFHNADAGILSYNSANVTMSDIETTGNRRAHYSVHLGNVHNVLVERVRVNNPSVHSLTVNTQSTKCVFKEAVVTATPVLDQHAGANHQNLFDNITVFVDAKRDKKKPYYPIWNGSGAGYWQPGHGRFNTTWNLKVNVQGGADRDEVVILEGLAEGPAARIVGVSGNREFEVDYYPSPYAERINVEMSDVPSLYDYQLQKRLSR
jgi:hypothetical protein